MFGDSARTVKRNSGRLHMGPLAPGMLTAHMPACKLRACRCLAPTPQDRAMSLRVGIAQFAFHLNEDGLHGALR